LIFSKGSVEKTRLVKSKKGAWIASTSTPKSSASALSATGSWLSRSLVTMTSAPWNPALLMASKTWPKGNM
jgi:hypothetical protein